MSVNMLLQKGADVNKADGKRDTPLAKAADVGNVDILKHLIASGANVNTLGYFHLPPLSRATENNHVQCIKVLLEAGADVNFSYSSRRFTPLASAVARGHLKSAEILIASGANVNAVAGEFGTAIMIAAKEMQSECINLLTNAGADVNMVGNYGFNVMMWAATRPYSQDVPSSQALDCIKTLLRSRARINIFCRGRNYLMFAMANDNKSWSNDDAAMLLFAAGEILEGEIGGTKVNTSDLQIPKCLQHKDYQGAPRSRS